MTDDQLPKGDHLNEPDVDHVVEVVDTRKELMPPIFALGFVIVALLGVLIVMGFKSGLLRRSDSAATDLVTLKSEIEARRNELNRQRLSMGLSPLAGNSEPIEAIAKRLKSDTDTLVSLAGRFQEMLAEKDAELIAKNSEILHSEQTRKALTDENARIQSDLQHALVQGAEAASIRGDLASIKSQRDALSTELADNKAKLNTMGAGVSAAEYADLKRRFDEAEHAKKFFENRVKELEGQANKIKLFASSETELLPAAVELYRSLRGLEGQTDSDMSTVYSGLGVKLGANVLQTLRFPTGFSKLAPADELVIKNLVKELPDGDLLLVIGYASKTGNIDSNRKLSSDRATAVAELYSSAKRPEQFVQAVYLGETDRFSHKIPERNQLVEIWRIRKK
jgi:outer membrane protein OmpA-like peptidoglycan-associated protein